MLGIFEKYIFSYRNLIVVILLTTFLSFFYSCENKFGPPKTDYKTGEIPDQESWNSTVIFSDSGRVKAVLKAGHISVYNSRYYTLVEDGAIVDFYDKNGEVVSTLTGKRGKVLEPSKDIEIYDSVVVVGKKNNTLVTTKRMNWINEKQRVYSDAFVKIKTDREEIEGFGFESDQNLKNYKVFKVTGIITK